MSGVNVGTAYLEIVPSAKGFVGKLQSDLGGGMSKAGDQAGKRFGSGMKGRIGGLAKGIVAPLAAATAALGVKDFLADSISEARESQKVGALTTQVIKSTGGAANVTADQVGNLATAISNKTGIDDETVQSGANMLLTFKNVRNEVGKGNDIFNQSTSILTDMSSAMGTEPKQAAIQLGKALNDPVKGITALSKVGVTFTEQQKKTIKSLVAGGKTAQAQKVILKELNSEFGGAAAAQATAGEKMKTAWQNLKEQIGTALLPVLDKVESFMTEKAVPAVSQFITEMQNGSGRGGAFVEKLKLIADKAKQLGDWIKVNVIPPVKEFIRQFKDGEGKGGQFRSILEKIGAAITAAFGWLQAHPDVVKTFVAGFGGLFAAKKSLDVAAAGMGAITDKITGVKEKFDKVKEGIQSVKDAGQSAKDAFNSVKDGITKIGGAAKSGAKWVKDFGAGQKIASAATKVWTGIQAAFNLVMSANPLVLIIIGLVALGVALVIAYKKSETFRNIVNGAFSKVKAIVSGVVNWFKTSFVPFFTKTIPNAFQSVLNFVKSHWKLILGLITGPIGAAVLLVISNWGRIKHAFSAAWNWVKGTFKTAWNGLKAIISTPVNLAKTLISRDIDAVKGIFSKAKDAIGTVWSGLQDKITGPIKSVLRWVGDHFVSPINSLLSKVGVGFRIPWPSIASGGTVAVGHGGGHVPRLALATGGVLPGYSPGTDNMHFVGPHGGLSLSGGEAIMRPEWTRAIGRRGVDAMNAAARTGGIGAVRKLLAGHQAFSIGGVIGDIGGGIKNVVGKGVDLAKDAVSFITNPGKIIKGLLGGIGGSFWGKIAKGALGKAVSGIVSKVTSFGGGAGGAMALGGTGSGKPGSGWQWMWKLISSHFPGVSLTSAFRPGAHTAGSGQLSMHALGRAIDIGGSESQLLKVARWIASNYGSKSADLLYTPAFGNMGIYRGKWYRQPAITTAEHGNHVHWGFNRGGVLPYRPPVFDQGGTLAPGINVVDNQLGKPEALRRADHGGQPIHIEINGVPMDNTQAVAKELLYSMNRNGIGKWASI